MKLTLILGLLAGTAALMAEPIAVANGNLENGTKNWNLYGTDSKCPAAAKKAAITFEAKDVHAGKGALRLLDDQSDYNLYTVNKTAIPAGKFKTVTIKAWIRGVKGNSARLGLMFHKKDGKKMICQKNVIKVLQVTDDWKEYSVTGDVPADSNYVFAMAGAGKMSADVSEILVDDVTMSGEAK